MANTQIASNNPIITLSKENNIMDKQVFESRWGFHPCSHETFLKLKKLRKHYFESLRKAAAWYRWARKQEQNRHGSEPSIPPVFCELINSSGHGYKYDNERTMTTYWVKDQNNKSFVYDIPGIYEWKSGDYWATLIGRNHDKTLLVRDHGILAAYEQARMPQSTADRVEPLRLTEAQIDILLSEFED